MSSETAHHEYAELQLACDKIIRAARKHGIDAARFDRRYLMLFIESTLKMGKRKDGDRIRWERNGTRFPRKSLLSTSETDNAEFSSAIANAAVIWCILNRLPGYESARLTCGFYDDAVSEGIQLYESAFGKIRSHDYERLMAFQSIREHDESGYPIFDHVSAGNYDAACIAWKAFQHQRRICEDAHLPREAMRLEAPEAIRILTGEAIDLSDAWEEDLVSYLLAEELLGALHVFYEDAIEQDKGAFEGATTLEELARTAVMLDMDLKADCFLDGVPASDIIA